MYDLEEESRRREKVLLVGTGPKSRRAELIESLEELGLLAETAGGEVAEKILHIRERPDAAAMIGKGKARKVEEIRGQLNVDTVVFDQELSSAQIRNLEAIIAAKILDRSELILDIFALHARTKEAKIEVELAQLSYRLPRLTGKGIDLSRLGGGIGTRGPGEKKLEVERRRLRDRMKKLKDELKSVEKARAIRRKRRHSMFRVALAGYTDAGKSTIMNALTKAGVRTEKALFTTLDPTTRVLQFENGRKALITDTVGFIRDLPHHLVASFRSTLEEAVEADLRLRIVDVSHPEFESHMDAGSAVLRDLGCLDKKNILVFNKIDRLLDREVLTGLSHRYTGCLCVSALTGEGMDRLLFALEAEMEREVIEGKFRLPMENGKLISNVHELGEVLDTSYGGGYAELNARLHKSDFEKIRKLTLEAGGEVKPWRCNVPKRVAFGVAVDEFLKELWRRDPVGATAVGIHDYDTELGDLSSHAIEDDTRWLKTQLSKFEGLDSKSLTKMEAEDLSLTIAMIRTRLLFLDEMRILEKNPVVYPEVCIYGCYLPSVRTYAPIEERLNSVVKRLSLIPGVLREGKANLSNPPRIWTDLAIESSEGAIMFMKGALPSLFEQVPKLKKDFEKASTQALAAVEEYTRFLKDDLLTRSSGRFGIGKDRFDFLLKEQHMLEFDSDSLLAFGESSIAKIEEELTLVANQVDPNRTWRDIIEMHKDDHPEPDELLRFYEEKIEQAKRFVVDKGLVTLPDEEILEVIPTPEFERPFLPYAAYLPPAPFEREQKGFFFVTTVSDELDDKQKSQQLRGHNRYKAGITALHEAYPGHHLQLTTSNAHPSKIRRLYGNNVFVEGWALYCEEMMYEQGFYPDATTRLFQLKDTLWRACRVVLDVKLHLNLVSFTEACDFLVKKAGLERLNAEKEVSRYTLSPTQPMSYLVGREEIRSLRKSIKAMKPGEFQLNRFHDWLLSHGSVPVGLILPESFFS